MKKADKQVERIVTKFNMQPSILLDALHENKEELDIYMEKWYKDFIDFIRCCEQLHSCKYVKREGESCTLNNNCKYPNCE